MNPQTRQRAFTELFPQEPAFRWRQVEKALFQAEITDWNGITPLPQELRQRLQDEIPWRSYGEARTVSSQDGADVRPTVAP